ncbi:kinase-like protein [Mytilinidion resinicola]|uniref:non-specific serine/threonine protein kinase n=1 Tax=Mytilinidion resinicola TaxID=574789 RepID=A0A6A6YRZ0_9PEZI|nr:kinase-like protein [Mytilinidion resinicola]KAF2810677.1 kinase-like protein [Mytilinidion resinicola]
MDRLRAQIRDIRCLVAGGKDFFIPLHSLYTLVTEAIVRDALSVSSIEWYRIDGITDKIYPGGRRIFAILVMLDGRIAEITRFIELDNLQDSPIDHKLPFSEQDLRMLVPSIAEDFYRLQWEFCAPILSTGVEHRFLDLRTVLPFTENTKIGEGGLGEVFRISIHPDHQNMAMILPSESKGLVRKQTSEIMHDSDSRYENELRSLSLLNQLEHPNISRLLSFYTYQRRRNFIFPLAQGGDLDKLFEKDPPPSDFREHFSFYKALSRLSSALEMVHDYTTAKKVDLRLIGLHRDLKPNNILVDGDEFILSDFGFSSFKPATELSRTPFKRGGADYLAPECEDLDDSFRSGIVSRPSDIWSFGCIMLEVLVYMLQGQQGVQIFRKERRFKPWHMGTFHMPGLILNGSVTRLLDALDSDLRRPVQQLTRLIRKIFAISPEERPKAAQITSELQFITLNELLGPISKKYANTVSLTKSIQARLEFGRFQSWKYVLNFIDEQQNEAHESNPLRTNFDESLALLQKVRSELALTQERHDSMAFPTFYELRSLNDCLVESLPVHYQNQAISFLDIFLCNDDTFRPGKSLQGLDDSGCSTTT